MDNRTEYNNSITCKYLMTANGAYTQGSIFFQNY